MDSPKFQFVGYPCGVHGPYVFHKAFRYCKEGISKVLSLGEFFFLKLVKNGPVCIGEVQLLWEDRTNSKTLSSVRLYFLPQHTPEGKQEYHGEDEVLALSDKLVLQLDDLVSLIIHNITWPIGSIGICEKDILHDASPNDRAESFAVENCGIEFRNIKKEKILVGDLDPTSTEVKIISFPSYCRYRAMMKRLENVKEKWLKNVLVSAIGGVTLRTRDGRILFCREVFEHPDLEELEISCNYLAPNLKGRPRKKRLSSKKGTSQESDSNEDSHSEVSTPSSAQSLTKSREKNKKESPKNGLYRGLNKESVCMEEQAFLTSLHKFMCSRNTAIERIPSLGFKQVDLYLFYQFALKLGGYEEITDKRLWKHLYDLMGGNPGSTSAATCTRRHYEKLLLPYERYMKGEEEQLPVAADNKVKKNQVSARKQQVKKEQPSVKKDGKHQSPKKKKVSVDLSILEKEKQWNEIRKQNALKRDKLRRLRSGNTKTVKKLLTGSENDSNQSKDGLSDEPAETSSSSDSSSQQQPLQAVKDNKSKTELPSEILESDLLHEKFESQPAKPSPTPSLLRQRTGPSIMTPLIQKQKRFQNQVQQILPKVTERLSPPLKIPATVRTDSVSLQSFTLMPQLSIMLTPLSNQDLEGKAQLRVMENVVKTDNRHDKQKNTSLSGRPSVIQHTVQNRKNCSESLEVTSYRQPEPAHSNHLKRSYPYTSPLNHVQAHTASTKFSPPAHVSPAYYETTKHPKLSQQNTTLYLQNCSQNFTRDHQQAAHYDDEQPTDLTMKTLRRHEDTHRNENSKTHPFILSKSPTNLHGSSTEANAQPENALICLMANVQENPGSSLNANSVDVVGDLCGSVPKAMTRSSKHSRKSVPRQIQPKVTIATSSPPLTQSGTPIQSQSLHPAFPQHLMQPQLMQAGVLSHLHMQRLFEAHICGTGQSSGPYENIQKDVYIPTSMIIPPQQLYSNVYKDRHNYIYPK